MTLAKRIVPAIGEKKRDDAVESTNLPGSAATAAMLTWRGPRKKRIFLSLVALCAVYLFIKYLPTNVPPVSNRSYDSRFPGFRRPLGSAPAAPVTSAEDAPPRPVGAVKERYFDGPVKFYHLSSGLYEVMVPHDNARNVLFGMFNVKSASNILPLACEMARRQKNKVHVAIFGRQDLAMEAIKDIYGTSAVECPVFWHDARPDFAAYSSDQRMEFSVRAALNHILHYLKPHAIMINDAGEDHLFAGAVTEASSGYSIPVISIPDLAIERIGWLSELDGASIANWDKLQIEILVHGSASSSASFIRLLKSIAIADYTGFAYPRLTVELPEIVDPPTLEFLSSFEWPPGSSQAESNIVVRRQLSARALSPIEASLRTIESFYPLRADRNHVLLLSPDAELSPSYLGYLKFLLLQYKYSTSASISEATSRLMGISLASPSQLQNGSNPKLAKIQRNNTPPIFLWQAPNCEAALYFGDKWLEFHSFLTHRLMVDASVSSVSGINDKVPKEYPHWMRFLLELVQCRAYHMLYPIVEKRDAPLVFLHEDRHEKLNHVYDSLRTTLISDDKLATTELSGKEVLTDDEERTKRVPATIRNTESVMSVLLTAIGNSSLPQLQSLPHLSYDGGPESLEIARLGALTYADRFSLDFGGCKTLSDRAPASAWTADDLFCDGQKFG